MDEKTNNETGNETKVGEHRKIIISKTEIIYKEKMLLFAKDYYYCIVTIKRDNEMEFFNQSFKWKWIKNMHTPIFNKYSLKRTGMLPQKDGLFFFIVDFQFSFRPCFFIKQTSIHNFSLYVCDKRR